MDGNKKIMDGNKETSHQRRISGMAKKAKELSILSDTETLFLSFNPNGKAELVFGPNTNFDDMVNRFVNLSPKERYESKLEGIKALKEAFKGNSHHEIDVQKPSMFGGSGTTRAIELGQQSSINMTEEVQRRQNLCARLVNDRLNILEAARKALILLNTKKMEKSIIKDRVSAVQHSYDEPPNIVPTVPNVISYTTIASNMLPEHIEDDLKNLSLRNSASNSDPLSEDLLMAESPGCEEERTIQ